LMLIVCMNVRYSPTKQQDTHHKPKAETAIYSQCPGSERVAVVGHWDARYAGPGSSKYPCQSSRQSKCVVLEV
jgi:hypothetical protein